MIREATTSLPSSYCIVDQLTEEMASDPYITYTTIRQP